MMTQMSQQMTQMFFLIWMYFIANYKPMPPYARVRSKSQADVLLHSLIFNGGYIHRTQVEFVGKYLQLAT